MAISVAAALLPVLVFLAVLLLMDSFKLVPLRAVVVRLCAGAVAALAAPGAPRLAAAGERPLAAALLPLRGAGHRRNAQGDYVVVVLRQRRLGFLVDAALVGFSVGTGFALVENIDYLRPSTTGPLRCG